MATTKLIPPSPATQGNLLLAMFSSIGLQPSPPDDSWSVDNSVSTPALSYFAFTKRATANEPTEYDFQFEEAPTGAAIYIEVNGTSGIVCSTSMSL